MWGDSGAVRVTWWGHATVLVEDGARVLTDPLLGTRLGHLVRRVGSSPQQHHLDVDLVVLSHLHADHLHLPSLRLLPEGTRVAVPKGGGRLLRRLPVEVVEVVAGDVLIAGATTVTAVPAVHDGRRWPGSRTRAPALGYVIHGAVATYFAGDTGLFPGLADVAADTGRALDLALLPVWGWGPWLRGQHLDPVSGAAALALLRPRVAVPVHWGTLWPLGLAKVRPTAFHGAGQAFADHARRAGGPTEVRVLAPGSSTSVAAAAEPD